MDGDVGSTAYRAVSVAEKDLKVLLGVRYRVVTHLTELKLQYKNLGRQIERYEKAVRAMNGAHEETAAAG